MNDTNQMVSVPCELLEQALDAAAAIGMQDVADELNRILTLSNAPHQLSSAVLWRYRENKPGRVWNYTHHPEIAEKSVRLGWEVQCLADARELEQLHADLVSVKADRDAYAQNAIDLRAQLADLKRRHDVLHRDMATIAGREVPKGVTVSDYAAAAIADALSASAEREARHD